MKLIDFFRLQAKNLFRDFKTKKLLPDDADALYEYTPKYFDIAWVVIDFNIDEDTFTLMKAQHTIAQMVGFYKWAHLEKASETELELAKLLFDNMHKISAEEWQMYITGAERDNNTSFDSEVRLDIFMQVFAEDDGHESYMYDYRLLK